MSEVIRNCTDCQRDVHWVDNAEQLVSAVAYDLCVSFSTSQIKPSWSNESDGLCTTGRPLDPDISECNFKKIPPDFLNKE